jgi:adenosine kinase
MKIVLSGSIAFDYLMSFPGHFSDHILPDRIDRLSLSFLVDSLVRQPGGIAANIAYSLALLGEHPTVMATVGPDFDAHRAWLEEHGVDTSAIRVVPDLLTASFFVNTDRGNAQIASFFPGAMARASELSFAALPYKPDLAVISPNEPGAMVAYARECKQLGIPFLYDPSQQIIRLDAEELGEGIHLARGLFCNDYEFGLIEKKTGLGTDAILDDTDFVVITRGEEGAELHLAGRSIHIAAIEPDQIADPTGVGDAFRGGFLKGYMHGMELETCARMGSLAAAYCLEAKGPQGHAFTPAGFLKRYKAIFNTSELDHLLTQAQ